MRFRPHRTVWYAATAVAFLLLGGCTAPAPPISVSVTASAPAIDQGRTISFRATVTNDSLARSVRWTVTGPGSISPATGSSASYYPPTASLSGAQPATITATSVADPHKDRFCLHHRQPRSGHLFPTLATGVVGTPYNQPIVLNGGTAPFQWTVYNGPIATGYQVGGSVPDGLALNPATERSAVPLPRPEPGFSKSTS